MVLWLQETVATRAERSSTEAVTQDSTREQETAASSESASREGRIYGTFSERTQSLPFLLVVFAATFVAMLRCISALNDGSHLTRPHFHPR